MAPGSDFLAQSKKLHSQGEAKKFWRGAYTLDNFDSLRHHQLTIEGLALVKGANIQSCLSIGDNRARDAAFAKKELNCYATASDLNIESMQRAVSEGFVDEILDIDVEKIPHKDASIDLVIAKESFHHWPRPFVGLYEMIRVAKKAVLLIEPFDVMKGEPLPYHNPSQFNDSYEQVGNYKYSLSLREILKVAWALRLPAVCARGFNDPAPPGDNDFNAWKLKKDHLDSLGDNNSRQYNLMAVAIFIESEAASKAEALLSCERGRFYWAPVDPFRVVD